MRSDKSRDSYRDRRFIFDLSLAVLPFSVLFYVSLREGKWEFENHVRVGMLREDVLAVVGEPSVKLQPGERATDRTDSKFVAGIYETWFYYVGPGSWEFKLTFEGDRVRPIELIGS